MNYKIFSYTNFKYVDAAAYWASFVEKLKLDYEIHCCDKQSYEYLLNQKVKCVLSKHLYEETNFNFTDFSLIRFKILSDLLDKYEYVIYSDVDAIWEDNPLEDIFKHPYEAHLSTVHHPNAYPASIRKEWGLTVCTGWMGFKSTARDLIQDFISQYYSFKTGVDQQRFNEFLA